MPWKARNRVEYRILEKFSEKLEENDDISPAVKDVIQESLKETTISQASEAKELTEKIIEEEEDASG